MSDDGKCPDCGHTWASHRNLVGCSAVVGKHPDSPNFEGATIRCFCESFPIEAGCAVHGSAHPCEECAALLDGWLPIGSAPKDGSRVLAWFPLRWGGHADIASWCAPPGGFAEHWTKDGKWRPGDDPSHWMPLPEGPHDRP